MKQVCLVNGAIDVIDVPPPACEPGGVVVRTRYSLISTGTDLATTGGGGGRLGLVKQAFSNPQLVRKVMDKAGTLGVRRTADLVRARLQSALPLGYSAAGEIVEVGEGVTRFRVGDRVACGGAGYANHAEYDFVPENLVTTIAVPDSVNTGTLRAVLQGPDLARVAIPPADAGVLGLGIRIDAPAPTGVRLASSASGAGAVFTTYATLNIPDTGTARLRTFTLVSAFNSSLAAVQPADDSTLLTIGGEPSSRAMLRFDLPPRIRDSAIVVRATLELTPMAPIPGLPTDPARLRARAVLADLGAKSPVESRFGTGADTVAAGNSGIVDIEVVRLMQQLWLASPTRPTALVVSLDPDLEAASFSRLVFHSTRAADSAVRPRLRVSYLRSFPFENP